MENETWTPRPLKEELKRLLPSRGAQLAWLVLAGGFIWFYWSSFESLVRAWLATEDYQHGFFVPIFSLFLLWLRRDMIAQSSGRGSWWGLPLFGVWAAMRWTAVYFNYGWFSEMSIIPFFAGVAIFVGGWQGLHWAWPAILFLVFMIPLPGSIQGILSEQLQSIATRISVYVIQTLGIPAAAQGNVIQLTDKPLEVARACSGLRMMMLFFAICIGAAFVSRRPLWERLVMVGSAAPIAVMSNVARIVMTAVAYEIASRWPSVIDLETSGERIHDWAGYLMMPIGLLLLLTEMWLLSKLLITSLHDRPLAMGRVLAESGPQEAIRPSALRRRRR
jgi:exosortase